MGAGRLGLGLVIAIAAGCGGGGGTPSGPKPDMAMSGGNPDGGGGGGDMKMNTTSGCDLVGQDCSKGDKCTVELMDDGMGNQQFNHACVSPTGTKKEGDKCNREGQSSSMPGTPGHDDCGPKNYCTANGLLTSDKSPQKYCRTFCLKQSDCKGVGTNEACVSISNGGDFGICVPQCTVFGSECTGSFTCAYRYPPVEDPSGNAIFTCRGVGTGAEGADCSMTGDLGCGANMLCLDPSMKQKFVCVALCDDTHKCSGTKTCMKAMGDKIGVCQ